MSLLKQKQISGLVTALGSKVESASNQGAGDGAIFKQLNGTDLEFHTLGDGNALNVIAAASDIIVFDVNVTGATATKSSTAVGADEMLIADSEAASVTKKITKTNFLADYAVLASPALTGTPTAPTASGGTNTTQLATTAFVTSAVTASSAGLDVKVSVRMATSSSVADLSDITVADIDGDAQGVTLVEGDRVLIKDTASDDGIEGVDAKRNGLYVVGTVTTGNAPLTRTSDADVDSEVTNGMFTFVGEGDHAGTGWVLTTADPITLDTTGLTFTQFSDATALVGTADRITVTAGVIDIASGYVGQSSITTLGTIATGTWEGTTIAVDQGGTGVTSLATQSVLATVAADTVVPVALAASELIGRAAAGNIAALSGSDVRVIAATRQVVDRALLTASSMTLGTLSQTPGSGTLVQIFINGNLQEETEDYTISGTTVTATSALNVSFGGTASDGAGFENDDEFQAVYEH